MPFPEQDGPGFGFPEFFYTEALALANAPYEYAANVGDDAVELLLSQFRKPKIEAMLRALVGPVQRLEDVLWHILTRVVDMANAEGVHLDLFGRILKLPRLGLSDTEYRSRLQVWQLVLRSTGKPEELIRIADLFDGVSEAGDVVVYDEGSGTGGIVITLEHLMTYSPNTLALFLRKAKGGGVNIQLVWMPDGPTTAFRFTAGAGYDDEATSAYGMGYAFDGDSSFTIDDEILTVGDEPLTLWDDVTGGALADVRE
jgi:hypothetical protein